MLSRFKKFINDHHLFSVSDQLILAVSGGVDSVVLVDLCSRAGYRFVIAHMNFNLRAEESKRDELFVRELAAKNNTPVFVNTVDAAAYASSENMSIQEAARELRYSWFADLRKTLQAEDATQIAVTNKNALRRDVLIVTAHHKDDSVETMMMNMFRGTGLTGLRGIMPLNDKLARPLLDLTKQEILTYANDQTLSWVEDSSNQLDKYTRNYFRNQLIPMLRGIYPQVEQNLYNNLDRFNQAYSLYREQVKLRLKKLVEYRGDEVHLPVRKLVKQAAWQTLLFELLTPYKFSAGQVLQVAELVHSGTGKNVVSEKYRVIRNRQWLIIAPVQQVDANFLVIEKDDNKIAYRDGVLSFENVATAQIKFMNEKPGIPVESASNIAYLDIDKIAFPLLLRRPGPGDYFYPLGMKKKKKIGRFMIDIKLSKTQKENVWVLESDKKLVWLVGHRIDDRFRITDSTQNVMVVRS